MTDPFIFDNPGCFIVDYLCFRCIILYKGVLRVICIKILMSIRVLTLTSEPFLHNDPYPPPSHPDTSHYYTHHTDTVLYILIASPFELYTSTLAYIATNLNQCSLEGITTYRAYMVSEHGSCILQVAYQGRYYIQLIEFQKPYQSSWPKYSVYEI